MSDIFISYKRKEQPIARRLAAALGHQGWSVWWDPHLHVGEHFDDAIEQALREAKCVIVLWSEQSVDSRYVRDEATYALNQDKLIPIAIEDVELPFRFASLQTAQLYNWDGSDSSPEFLRIVDDIRTKIGLLSSTSGTGKSKDEGETKPSSGERTESIKVKPEVSSKRTGHRTKAEWLSNVTVTALLGFFYLAAVSNACSNDDMLALSALIGFPLGIFLIFQKRAYRIVWLLAPFISFFIGMPYGHNYGTITRSPLFGLEQGTDCQPEPIVMVVLGVVAIMAIIDHAVFLRSDKRK